MSPRNKYEYFIRSNTHSIKYPLDKIYTDRTAVVHVLYYLYVLRIIDALVIVKIYRQILYITIFLCFIV